MAATTTGLFRVLEQSVALLAVPSHTGPYVLYFPSGQRKGLLGVAGMAGRMLIGFGSGRN